MRYLRRHCFVQRKESSIWMACETGLVRTTPNAQASSLDSLDRLATKNLCSLTGRRGYLVACVERRRGTAGAARGMVEPRASHAMQESGPSLVVVRTLLLEVRLVRRGTRRGVLSEAKDTGARKTCAAHTRKKRGSLDGDFQGMLARSQEHLSTASGYLSTPW